MILWDYIQCKIQGSPKSVSIDLDRQNIKTVAAWLVGKSECQTAHHNKIGSK